VHKETQVHIHTHTCTYVHVICESGCVNYTVVICVDTYANAYFEFAYVR
jgi:hypothetical protein